MTASHLVSGEKATSFPPRPAMVASRFTTAGGPSDRRTSRGNDIQILAFESRHGFDIVLVVCFVEEFSKRVFGSLIVSGLAVHAGACDHRACLVDGNV